MRVIMRLPRDDEVKSLTFDEEKGEITIEPLFTTTRSAPAIAYLTVEGANGQKMRGCLHVSGSTGELRTRTQEQEAVPLFDLSAADAAKKRGKEPEKGKGKGSQ